MKCLRTLLGITLSTTIMLVAIGSGANASDKKNKPKSMDDQLQTATEAVGELSRADTGQTTPDIELIRAWIGQAQAFIASENEERAKMVTDRVSVMATYVKVKQKRLAAQAATAAAMEQARAAEDDARQMKRAATASRNKMNKLEATGL